MPGWLQAVSKVNPLSYEVDALRGLLIGTPAHLWLDAAVLVSATIAGVAAAALLLPRLARCSRARWLASLQLGRPRRPHPGGGPGRAVPAVNAVAGRDRVADRAAPPSVPRHTPVSHSRQIQRTAPGPRISPASSLDMSWRSASRSARRQARPARRRARPPGRRRPRSAAARPAPVSDTEVERPSPPGPRCTYPDSAIRLTSRTVPDDVEPEHLAEQVHGWPVEEVQQRRQRGGGRLRPPARLGHRIRHPVGDHQRQGAQQVRGLGPARGRQVSAKLVVKAVGAAGLLPGRGRSRRRSPPARPGPPVPEPGMTRQAERASPPS